MGDGPESVETRWLAGATSRLTGTREVHSGSHPPHRQGMLWELFTLPRVDFTPVKEPGGVGEQSSASGNRPPIRVLLGLAQLRCGHAHAQVAAVFGVGTSTVPMTAAATDRTTPGFPAPKTASSAPLALVSPRDGSTCQEPNRVAETAVAHTGPRSQLIRAHRTPRKPTSSSSTVPNGTRIRNRKDCSAEECPAARLSLKAPVGEWHVPCEEESGSDGVRHVGGPSGKATWTFRKLSGLGYFLGGGRSTPYWTPGPGDSSVLTHPL